MFTIYDSLLITAVALLHCGVLLRSPNWKATVAGHVHTLPSFPQVSTRSILLMDLLQHTRRHLQRATAQDVSK